LGGVGIESYLFSPEFFGVGRSWDGVIVILFGLARLTAAAAAAQSKDGIKSFSDFLKIKIIFLTFYAKRRGQRRKESAAYIT
jgi:hypothetical protein